MSDGLDEFNWVEEHYDPKSAFKIRSAVLDTDERVLTCTLGLKIKLRRCAMSEENPASWMTTYSMPVVPAGERFVKLSGLAEKHKREAWSFISCNRPALAALLKDPMLKELVSRFDADLYVEAGAVPTLPPEPLRGRKRVDG